MINSFDEINTYSAEQFESFLKERLFLTTEQNSRMRDSLCDFRHLSVPFGDSYLDSLVNLYSGLVEPAKKEFKNGLVSLFRHATFDDFSSRGLKDLLYVIGMTKSYQGITALVPVLGTGVWGEKYPELIYDALSIILMFPSPNEAYTAVRNLATSVNFRDKYVFDAYTALIASRPEDWVADLKLLEARFCRLIDNFKGDAVNMKALERREQRLVQQMHRLIPLAAFADDLNNLDPFAPIGGRLLKHLLGRNGPLAVETTEEGDYKLVDREDPASRVIISIATRLLVALEMWKLIDSRMRDNWDEVPALFEYVRSPSEYIQDIQSATTKVRKLLAKAA